MPSSKLTPIASTNVETVVGLISVLLSITVIALHVISLTYLYKLENINCICAEHPYAPYLKFYMVISAVLLTVNMFVPFLGPIGETASVIHLVFLVIWCVATIVFFLMAVRYVQYLVKEKCKCSEDVRRQILYIWSVLELTLLALVILLPLFIFVIMGIVTLFMNTTNMFKSIPESVNESVTNPVKSIQRVPGKLREQLRKVSRKFKLRA